MAKRKIMENSKKKNEFCFSSKEQRTTSACECNPGTSELVGQGGGRTPPRFRQIS